MESPSVHPLKIFDLAKSQGRLVYTSAPMVRYSKLAFRQTVHSYGVDICWTPMILAKEFNRSHFARDSDLTMSTGGSQPPTVVQFGSNSPLELSRASSLAAPFVNGVDLNCGCPQSWACAETLGAALMERRELVRDMVVETRERLRRDGWAVGGARDADSLRGRSVSVKIRVHGDLRKTIDFIDTVLGHGQDRYIDFLTIHPRTRRTPSREPINVEALQLLTEKYGDRVPILVSGDVFALHHLPFSSPRLRRTAESDEPVTGGGEAPAPDLEDPAVSPTAKRRRLPPIPKLAGLMSARGILANPALFAGHTACPLEALELFMSNAARAPLPLKLVLHHVSEMTGPGMGPDKSALLSRKDRAAMLERAGGNMCDLIDFLDERLGRWQEDGSFGLRRDPVVRSIVVE